MTDGAPRIHDQEVGAKLRELRLRYVLKQEELAQVLGVKHAAISRWERGARGLTVAMLLTIAERFGIPAAELLPERHRASPASPPDRWSRAGRTALVAPVSPSAPSSASPAGL